MINGENDAKEEHGSDDDHEYNCDDYENNNDKSDDGIVILPITTTLEGEKLNTVFQTYFFTYVHMYLHTRTHEIEGWRINVALKLVSQ